MTKKKRIYLLFSVITALVVVVLIFTLFNPLGGKKFHRERECPWDFAEEIDYDIKDLRDTLNLTEMEIIARQIASAYLMNETIMLYSRGLSKPIEIYSAINSYSDLKSAVPFYIYTRRTAKGKNTYCYSKQYLKCIDSYLFFMSSVYGVPSYWGRSPSFLISMNKRGQTYLLNGFPQNDLEMLLRDQLKKITNKETADEVFYLINRSRFFGMALTKDDDYDSSAFSNYPDIVKEKTIVEKEDAFIVNATFKKDLEYDDVKSTTEYKNIDIIISKEGKATFKIIKEKIYTEKR
ncbi:MAG: hypothetical protein WCS69_13610 [Ignavibacteriaceae bacterium]|jgi:hypothetical protein